MDVDDFKSRLLLTRDWEVERWPDTKDEAGNVKPGESLGAKYTLRMPSDQAVQRIYDLRRVGNGAVADAELAPIFLELSLLILIGWKGVTAEMIDPGGKMRGEIPFDAEFARYLLESNQDLTAVLANAYWLRIKERNSKREENRKNLERASNTSEV